MPVEASFFSSFQEDSLSEFLAVEVRWPLLGFAVASGEHLLLDRMALKLDPSLAEHGNLRPLLLQS